LEKPLPKSSSETFTSASRGVPQDVAALVLLAALDERRRTEVLDDRFAQRLPPSMIHGPHALRIQPISINLLTQTID